MKEFLKCKVGFGTFLITDQEKIDLVIRAAILNGYDFIDTAYIYKNEAMIGKAIKKFKKEFPNKEIPMLQSKVWPDFFNKDVEAEVRKSMKRLGNLEVIDAMLLHRPHVDMTHNVKAWKELIKCQKKGLVKHIGVSNFEPDMMRILFNETGVMPEIIQDELSVSYLRKDRVKFVHDNIQMAQAWRTMGNTEQTLKDPLVKKLAKEYKCTIAQLLMAYAKYWNYVPIIKSENEARIAENIKGMKIKLKKVHAEELEAKLNLHESTLSSKTDSYAYLSLKNK